MVYYRLALIVDPIISVAGDWGRPMQFPDAKAAIAYASANGHIGYRPAVIVDHTWEEREHHKCRTEYQHLAWGRYGSYSHDLTAIPGHYAHVSITDLDKVAFTETPEKGMLDLQTRMTPGKYLAKFYPHLTQTEILKWTNAHREKYSKVECLWASTPDEIEAVYSMSATFSSCVQHGADHFKSPVHPCRIYGAGDLSLAYMVNASGMLSARALVWKDRNMVGRMYGDDTLLRAALAKSGIITKSGQCQYDLMNGAKLLRIKVDGYLVAPYIDGVGHVTDHGDHLTMDELGDHQCSTPSCEQTGFESSYEAEEGRTTCPHCDDECGEDEMREVYTSAANRTRTDYWCECCVDNDAFYCNGTHEYYSQRAFTCVDVDGDSYCLERNDDLVCSDNSEEYMFAADAVTLENGDVWSRSEFEDDGFTCPIDGTLHANSDGVDVDGILYSPDAELPDAELPDAEQHNAHVAAYWVNIYEALALAA